MIESYFLNLEKTLAEFSNGCCVSITKKIYNAKQSYINGSIIFTNNDRLDFVEVVNTDSQNIAFLAQDNRQFSVGAN